MGNLDKILLLVYGVIGLAILYLASKFINFKWTDSDNPVSSLANKLTGGESNTSIGSRVYDAFNNADGSFKFPWQDSKPIQSSGYVSQSSDTLKIDDRRFTVMPVESGAPLKKSSPDLMSNPIFTIDPLNYYSM